MRATRESGADPHRLASGPSALRVLPHAGNGVFTDGPIILNGTARIYSGERKPAVRPFGFSQ
jgi:hypothetical protein